jgi:carbonic anhydrase
MIEICWRYDPATRVAERRPATAPDAIALLRDGNAAFAALGTSTDIDARHVVPIVAEDLGLGASPGHAPKQAPFAALLGCADARVPLELVFAQSANDAFVVRVAGNVLAAECVGSLDYAVSHLPTLRLLAVLGHTGCGAVSATVDGYLEPAGYLRVTANLPLRAIVDSLVVAVHAADRALRDRHGDGVAERSGYRLALVDVAVVLNAAVAADALRTLFTTRLGDTLGVAFGVYDLATRQVGLPDPMATDEAWRPGLVAAPDAETFTDFARDVAGSAYVESLLATTASAGH